MDVFVEIARSGDDRPDGTSANPQSLAFAANLRARMQEGKARGTLNWRDLMLAAAYEVAAAPPSSPLLQARLESLSLVVERWHLAVLYRRPPTGPPS